MKQLQYPTMALQLGKSMPFHRQKLPSFSTLLTGRIPPDEVGVASDRLQIWYNNSGEGWADDGVHAHQESDEFFIVPRGDRRYQSGE